MAQPFNNVGFPPQGPGAPEPGSFPTTPIITSVSPSADRNTGGATITITGRNFRYGSLGESPIVLIGGTPATNVVVVSSTSITCTAPAHAVGLVGISVQCFTPNETGTASGVFTYFSATATDVSPAFGPLAGGTSIIIEGVNFEAGSTVKVGGVAATGVTIFDTKRISAVTPARASSGFVDVVVIGPAAAYSITVRNGFQYVTDTTQEIRRLPSISISSVLNQAPNSCTYKVDGESPKPQVGDPVTILDGATIIFTGTVQTVLEEYEGQRDQLVWTVTAVDNTWLFNRRRPFGEFVDAAANEIAVTLISQYAPDFSANHVQTGLQKVTISFDGTQTMADAFTALGEAIGGGHWYVDNDLDVHFFHVQPPGVSPLDVPESQIQLGPGSAMVATDAGFFAFTNDFASAGFFAFTGTFVYDNGAESDYWPFSNMIPLGWTNPNGPHSVQLTSIPIGATVNGHVVTKRRLYFYWIGASLIAEGIGIPYMWISWHGRDRYGAPLVPAVPGPIIKRLGYVEIEDNSTTSFTSTFAQKNVNNAAVIEFPVDEVPPPVASVAPPLGPSAPPLVVMDPDGKRAANSAFSSEWPAFNDIVGSSIPVINAQGQPIATVALVSYDTRWPSFIAYNASSMYQLKMAFLYRDGTISLPGPPSSVFKPKSIADSFAEGNLNTAGYTALTTPISYNLSPNQAALQGQTIALDPSKWAIAPIQIASEAAGPTVNGVDVIARIFYAAELTADLQVGDEFVRQPDLFSVVSPDRITMWAVSENNTSVGSRFLGPGVGVSQRPESDATDSNLPIWPHPDGPYLEGTDPPEDLDAANNTLLRNPQLTLSEDLSQIRNRIFVIGAGTSATIDNPELVTFLTVADASIFSSTGGTILVNRLRTLAYKGIDTSAGQNRVVLQVPLSFPIPAGATLEVFLQVDDADSQNAMAQIEGGDGAHEYTVTDSSLTSPFELLVRGKAELELFARPVQTIHYATRDPKTKIGQVVHVDLTDPPVSGDFLIQSVDIDQFYDESDQVTPRYTVQASSVRFDLNDLLLKIVTNASQKGGQSGSSGASSGGLVTASIQGAASTVASRQNNLDRSWWYVGSTGLGAIAQFTGAAGQNGSFVAGSAQTEADRVWQRITPNNTVAGFSMSTIFCHEGLLPYVEFVIRTGSDITNTRVYAGWQKGTGATPSASGKNFSSGGVIVDGVGVHFTSVAADALLPGWRGFSSQASVAMNFGAPFLTVNPNTIYHIKIEILSPVSTKITINGVSQLFTKTPFTTGLQNVTWVLSIDSGASGTTRFLDFGWAYMDRITIPGGAEL